MPTSQFDGRPYQAIAGMQEKCVQTTTAQTLLNGRVVFRVNGGPVIIKQLVSYCITANDATATTLQWSADGDVGAATTITAASTTLASFIAGSTIVGTLTGLAGALVLTGTTGVVAASVDPGIIIPAGIITTVVVTGPSTGTWLHFARFAPLSPGAVMAVA